MRAREVDAASTFLIELGTHAVKRNPIKTSLYLVGILICLLFNGWTVTDTQRREYHQELQKLDTEGLDNAFFDMQRTYHDYYRSKGWFTCNSNCQVRKEIYESSKRFYENMKREEDSKLAVAKSKLGIFSEYGVEEARSLFWQRFAQGKGLAMRQTKYDAIFMGIGAMARDENLLSYLLRALLTLLFNFTIGVFGAVIAFIFSLYSLIQSFNTSFIGGVIFFALASVAAISFALTWLLGLYAAAAGTTYVGLKIVASNLRIENGGGYRNLQR